MATSKGIEALPSLPEYTLHPLPPLVSPIPDKFLTLLLPIIAYWMVSMFFHWIDINNYLAKYRLHTPAEILKRNHVSRYHVARDVIIQQIIQTIVGGLLGMSEPTDFYGKEEYDVAVWARRIRSAEQLIPSALAILSVDSKGLAKNLAAYPALAGALSGGVYHTHNATMLLGETAQNVAGFQAWEVMTARILYWGVVPAIQFFVAMVAMDTWQYFLHRAMHMNKWLYTSFHSRHHRLYVPYAYGALYNHPFEGFLLDTLGGAISYKIAGLNTRQGMWFFTCSTIKTVDDHCGYALPWDPLQLITTNNASYHDVHHQSWGIKTNFSQPCFTFWDRLLGTKWQGGDVSARYERAARAAQLKVDADKRKGFTGSTATSDPDEDTSPYNETTSDVQSLPAAMRLTGVLAGKAEQQAAESQQQVLDDTSSAGGTQILVEEALEESGAAQSGAQSTSSRKGNRRRTASSLANSDSLRGLRDRVSVHGRAGGILGMDHTH